MTAWVLVIFMATSGFNNSGSAGVEVGFNTQKACELAGNTLTTRAHERDNYVLVWGCFQR